MNALIYDCEIVRPVPSRTAPRVEGIKYCKGWTDYQNMGISVVCAYQYATDRYRVFGPDNSFYFEQLVKRADLLIGFNSRRFDDNLLGVHGIHIPPEKTYDVLIEIWGAAGLSSEYQHGTHAGFSLDACIRANFKLSKSQDGGAMAPIQWQRGEVGKVIDYCLFDVYALKLLVDRIVKTGELVNPINPKEQLQIRKPW